LSLIRRLGSGPAWNTSSKASLGGAALQALFNLSNGPATALALQKSRARKSTAKV